MKALLSPIVVALVAAYTLLPAGNCFANPVPLPDIVADRVPNQSAGFAFRAFRSSMRPSSDSDLQIPRSVTLNPSQLKSVAAYQMALTTRIKSGRHFEAPIAAVVGYELVQRKLLKRDDLPGWLKDVQGELESVRKRNWSPSAERLKGQLGLGLEVLELMTKNPRIKFAGDVSKIALQIGLLDPLLRNECNKGTYNCNFYANVTASEYADRSVEALLSRMLSDQQFARTVDNFFVASGIANFQITDSEQSILAANPDLQSLKRLDRIERLLRSRQEKIPVAGPDGKEVSSVEQVVSAIKDEHRALLVELTEVLKSQRSGPDKQQQYQASLDRIETINQGMGLLVTMTSFVDGQLAGKINSLSNATVQAARASAELAATNSLASTFATANAYLVVMNVAISMFAGQQGPSADELILSQLAHISQQIARLQENMSYRFDRVESVLDGMLRQLNSQLNSISADVRRISLDTQAIRSQLNQMQEDLRQLKATMVIAVLDTAELRYTDYEVPCLDRRDSGAMPFEGSFGYSDCATTFLNWATNFATVSGKTLAAEGSTTDLTTMARVAGTLDNIILKDLSTSPLPSISAWQRGATAYLGLLEGNPQHAGFTAGAPPRRNTLADIRDIIKTGERLEAAARSIFFAPIKALGPTQEAPVWVPQSDFVSRLFQQRHQDLQKFVDAIDDKIDSLVANELIGISPFDPKRSALSLRDNSFNDEIAAATLQQCSHADIKYKDVLPVPKDWAARIGFGIKLAAKLKWLDYSVCYRLTAKGMDYESLAKASGSVSGPGGRPIGVIVSPTTPQDDWDRLRESPKSERPIRIVYVVEVLLEGRTSIPKQILEAVSFDYKSVVKYEIPFTFTCDKVGGLGEPIPAANRTAPSGFPFSDEMLYCKRWINFKWQQMSLRQFTAENLPAVLFGEDGIGSRPPIGPYSPLVKESDGFSSEYPRFRFDNAASEFILRRAFDEGARRYLANASVYSVMERNDGGVWERLATSNERYKALVSLGLESELLAISGRSTNRSSDVPPFLTAFVESDPLSSSSVRKLVEGGTDELFQNREIFAGVRGGTGKQNMRRLGDTAAVGAAHQLIDAEKESLLVRLRQIRIDGRQHESITREVVALLEELRGRRAALEIAGAR